MIYWDFHAQSVVYRDEYEYLVSSSCMDENALLM